MLDILLYVLVGALFVLGVIISLFNLPGIWAVFIGILIFAKSTNFEVISSNTLWVLVIISLFITFIDNITMPIGAKKFGASKWGMAGALIGGFVGMLVGNIIGLLVGPLMGAIIFELTFAKKDTATALKAGIGALIGFITSIVIKFGGVVAMALWGVVVMWRG